MLMCYAAGAPGWSNSSTRALSRQIPSTAASTSSVGSIYSASTFQVDDGAQCGGTGGEPEHCVLKSGQAKHLQLQRTAVRFNIFLLLVPSLFCICLHG